VLDVPAGHEGTGIESHRFGFGPDAEYVWRLKPPAWTRGMESMNEFWVGMSSGARLATSKNGSQCSPGQFLLSGLRALQPVTIEAGPAASYPGAAARPPTG
jgi:hypothetical protein